MRRSLGILALLGLVLTGCGGDDGDGGRIQEDPVPVVTQVDVLTGTSAGGSVATSATPLPDHQAVREYAAQFRNDVLGGEIVTAAEQAEVPEGQQLAAAVVAVGCEVPVEVEGSYEHGGDGGQVRVSATLPPPEKQCLAPITSVALMLVPDWISAERPAGGR